MANPKMPAGWQGGKVRAAKQPKSKTPKAKTDGGKRGSRKYV